MSIVIDILLVVIFIAWVIVFSKYGFARTIYKIGKTWLSVFCSMVIGPWVSGQLEVMFFKNTITNGINNTLTSLIEKNPNGYNLQQLFENLPEGFVGFLKTCGIDFAQLEAEYGASTNASEEIVQAISVKIADPCIQIVSSIIGHLICFIVPLVFFTWLNFQIRKRRVAFFRYIDHVVGCLVGIAIGYCVSLVLAMLLRTAFQVVLCFDAGSSVSQIYSESYVLKFLNEFNSLEFIKQTYGMLMSKLG